MATPATGRPRGRPKGARNRRTEAREAAVAQAAASIAEEVAGAFSGDAHAFLMLIYKDPKQPVDLRVDAAKASIRYEKPALASVSTEISGPNGGAMELVTTYALPANGR